MKVSGWIGDMRCNSSSEHYWLVNEFVAEKLGGFHSLRIILHGLDSNDSGPKDMLRVLSRREPK
jgi:aspartate/glutamate racemase